MKFNLQHAFGAAAALICSIALPASARPLATPPAILAFLPAIVVHQGETQENPVLTQNAFNPLDSYNRDVDRFVMEARNRRWPFSIADSDAVDAACQAVIGNQLTSQTNYQFGQLKSIARRIPARYLVLVSITEITSYRKTNTFTAMAEGRASITLTVYDATQDAYVWQDSTTSSSARGDIFHSGSLSARQDQALLNCMLNALTPFAKGQREVIERPQCNAIAQVEQVIPDGSQVLINVGSGQDVITGMQFEALGSSLVVTVKKVFTNGALATYSGGTPSDGEPLVPKASN